MIDDFIFSRLVINPLSTSPKLLLHSNFDDGAAVVVVVVLIVGVEDSRE